MSQMEELNLEEGYPTAEEAVGKLVSGLQSAKSRRVTFLKVIHGWGSGGKGGTIKRAFRRYLPELKEKGLVKEWIEGSDWKVTDPIYLKWYQKYPAVQNDRDLNRTNLGITWLRIK